MNDKLSVALMMIFSLWICLAVKQNIRNSGFPEQFAVFCVILTTYQLMIKF